MSRLTYNPVDEYTGDGSTSSYNFLFKIETLSQLLVIVMDGVTEVQRVRGTNSSFLSSVTFDPVDGGGTVNLQANLTSGHKIYLLLANDEPVQDTLFRNKGSFTLRRIELALDKVLGPIQRLVYRVNRSFRIHETDDPSSFNVELPAGITAQGGKLLGINEAGTALEVKDELDASAIASGVLPSGGGVGATLEKATSADGDVQWNEHEYSGFSARFNENFSSDNLQDTLEKILDLSYVGPLVSLAASGSNTIREKGNSVASTTLTATVTKRTDPIARINFKRDGTSIDDKNPPSNTGSGNTNSVYSTSFSDNTTFSVEVTDDGTSGGPTTVSSSRSFTFVYPYYYGIGAAGLTAAQVAALTKDVRTENNNLNVNFGATTSQVYYFAYPASYGTLSSILDENGFETIGDWTLTVANITGLDSSAQSYNIYEFDNVVSAGATDYTFAQ